jgi:hypothetical protein
VPKADIASAIFIAMAIFPNSLSRGDFVSVLLLLRHERAADSRGPLRVAFPAFGISCLAGKEKTFSGIL